jgi:excisionase family DNA binding protein
MPAIANGPSGEVLTLSEAAAYLRFPEADVLRLVEEQSLPTRRLGNDWRFLKTAIQHWLATGSPTWQSRKAAILELAGKYTDDPELEQIVAEAYRRRCRTNREGNAAENPGG